LDACADPADPKSVPGGSLCLADIAPENGDGMVNVIDLLAVISQWGGGPGSAGDIAPGCGDGIVNVTDLLAVISAWGACP
ncbi:MAG: dockerin type I domain-containing protein, partial [Phycisphaerales bacterium]|nr:dockerin type I domain-containing protein [Phycisphaerales bacterium]